MLGDRVVKDAGSNRRRRLLCRFDDHQPFAYARGEAWFRCEDGLAWAQLREGWLVSARSGEPIAYRRDAVFYDARTHQPVYYLSP